MGIYDRDYTRPAPRRSQPPGLTPVTKGLLVLNVLICVLDLFILPKLLGIDTEIYPPPLTAWGAFTIRSAVFEGRIWEFLTFQFLHANLGHILANGLGLFVFGPWMERWWGSARFLIFYLLCGVAGAAFYAFLVFTHVLNDPYTVPLIGASAGIYGILIGVAVVAPDLRVQLLFPPIEMSIRHMAMIVLAIAVAVVIFNLENAGGQAGHLGGAILGFILVKWPFLLGRGNAASLHNQERRESVAAKLRPRTTVDLAASTEIDRILDKISAQGFQSLTDAERDALRNASDDSRP